MRRWALMATLLAVIPALAGCATRYRTEYHYHAPDSADARACVDQCETRARQCRSDAVKVSESDYAKCSERAYAEYEHCKTYTKGLCYRPVCVVTADDTVEYRNCEQDYKNCFEDCGGRVDVRELCEANC